jgi:hypothetical protein
MGLSLQKFTADAETGRLLKQQLTQGLQVVELTPGGSRSFLHYRPARRTGGRPSSQRW